MRYFSVQFGHRRFSKPLRGIEILIFQSVITQFTDLPRSLHNNNSNNNNLNNNNNNNNSNNSPVVSTPASFSEDPEFRLRPIDHPS
jgi:hypothetical protein